MCKVEIRHIEIRYIMNKITNSKIESTKFDFKEITTVFGTSTGRHIAYIEDSPNYDAYKSNLIRTIWMNTANLFHSRKFGNETFTPWIKISKPDSKDEYWIKSDDASKMIFNKAYRTENFTPKSKNVLVMWAHATNQIANSVQEKYQGTQKLKFEFHEVDLSNIITVKLMVKFPGNMQPLEVKITGNNSEEIVKKCTNAMNNLEEIYKNLDKLNTIEKVENDSIVISPHNRVHIHCPLFDENLNLDKALSISYKFSGYSLCLLRGDLNVYQSTYTYENKSVSVVGDFSATGVKEASELKTTCHAYDRMSEELQKRLSNKSPKLFIDSNKIVSLYLNESHKTDLQWEIPSSGQGKWDLIKKTDFFNNFKYPMLFQALSSIQQAPNMHFFDIRIDQNLNSIHVSPKKGVCGFDQMKFNIPMRGLNVKQIEFTFQKISEQIDEVYESFKEGKKLATPPHYEWKESNLLCLQKATYETFSCPVPEELKLPNPTPEGVRFECFPNQEIDLVDKVNLDLATISYQTIVVKKADIEKEPLPWVALWRDPLTYEKKYFILNGNQQEIEANLKVLQERLSEQHRVRNRRMKARSKTSYEIPIKNLQKTAQEQKKIPEATNLDAYQDLKKVWRKAFGKSNPVLTEIIRKIEAEEAFTGVPNPLGEKTAWYKAIKNMLGHILPKMQEYLASNDLNKKELVKIHLQFFVEMANHCGGNWMNAIVNAYTAITGVIIQGEQTLNALAVNALEEAKVSVAQIMRGNTKQNVHVYNWVVKCLDAEGIVIPQAQGSVFEDVYERFGKIVYKDQKVVLNIFKDKINARICNEFRSLIQAKEMTDQSYRSDHLGEIIKIAESKGVFLQDPIYINCNNAEKITDEEKKYLQIDALIRAGYLEECEVKSDGRGGIDVAYQPTDRSLLLLLNHYGVIESV